MSLGIAQLDKVDDARARPATQARAAEMRMGGAALIRGGATLARQVHAAEGRMGGAVLAQTSTCTGLQAAELRRLEAAELVLRRAFGLACEAELLACPTVYCCQ
ncbi:hypothetical protein WJX81_001663 [Elliptochloris bilobata]|uniref:Uncharacterized protein n=1 Tax=Elliptochloris bilobata TaxID=381761 RepID=A0AAW1RXF6_9CHLO